jgi:DNA-binding Lrp family transcriptional regulator
MAVFDVADDQVDELGQQLGQLDCVSHCYRRPRHLPHWPYNLFAMVHGGSRRAVREQQASFCNCWARPAAAMPCCFPPAS